MELLPGNVLTCHIIVTRRLKAETVKSQEVSIARQRLGKQISVATDMRETQQLL
jgi:hypothetical protein